MAALFTQATAESVYLLEVMAQPPGGSATSGRSDFGDLAWGEQAEPDDIANTAVALRFASAPYRTRPDDEPANLAFEHRLTQPLRLARALPLAPNEAGIVALSFGEVELANADGGLDALVQGYAIDGRSVTLRRIEPGAPWAQAQTLFAGTALGWRLADRTTVVLGVRGQAHRLETTLQSSFYTGAGAANGDADLKNVPRPLAFGHCANVSPRLVDAFEQLWQAHDGPVEAVAGVFDGGVALSAGSDHATVGELLAATVAGGTYDTCLAAGYFRLGSNPVYEITADVEGDKTGGVFAEDSATIARRMLTRAGIDSSELDSAAFDALAAAQPAPVGYFLREPIAAADAIAELLAGIGAYLGETADGRFTAQRLEAPEAAADEVDEAALLDLGLGALPESLFPCVWRVGVEWGRNWTPQNIALDAANIPPARLAFINVGARTAVAFDTDRQAIHRQARDWLGVLDPVRGFFRDEDDAEDEAERLLALWAPGRQVLVLPVQAEAQERDIGDLIAVRSPRFGLASASPARVFGVAFDAGEALLTLQLLR